MIIYLNNTSSGTKEEILVTIGNLKKVIKKLEIEMINYPKFIKYMKLSLLKRFYGYVEITRIYNENEQVSIIMKDDLHYYLCDLSSEHFGDIINPCNILANYIEKCNSYEEEIIYKASIVYPKDILEYDPMVDISKYNEDDLDIRFLYLNKEFTPIHGGKLYKSITKYTYLGLAAVMLLDGSLEMLDVNGKPFTSSNNNQYDVIVGDSYEITVPELKRDVEICDLEITLTNKPDINMLRINLDNTPMGFKIKLKDKNDVINFADIFVQKKYINKYKRRS